MNCNLCGESMIGYHGYKSGMMDPIKIGPQGLIEAKVIGTYFSDHLLDCHQYTFSLCELCLRKLFIKCVIPPKVNECSIFDEKIESDLSFEEEQKIYEYQAFEKNGGALAAYKNGLCNSIKDCKNKAIYSHFYSGEFSTKCCCEEHWVLNKNCLNLKLEKFIPDSLKVYI